MERTSLFGWLRRGNARADPAYGLAPRAADAPVMFPRVRTPKRVCPITPVVWVPDAEPPKASLRELGLGSFELSAGEGAPIRLIRLRSDTVVFGSGQFVTASGGCFVDSQLPAGLGGDHVEVDAVAPLDLPVVEVEDEILLAARHDIADWRQWLAALLPALLLVEQRFPGRFKLLLPQEVVHPAPIAPIWHPIAQSLQACGIDLARVYASDPMINYRFSALYAVEPVWAGGTPHPEATEALRQACAHLPAADGRLLSLAEPTTAMTAAPAGHDDDPSAQQPAASDPGASSFSAQVSAFKGAIEVHVPTGADPSGLIFAPVGVHVVASRQDAARTVFLEALVRDRRGTVTYPAPQPA